MAITVISFSGCSRESEWQQKYSDCKMLAAAINNEPSQFIKSPDCERIPELCSKTPQSPACQNELKKYFRK